MEKITTKKVLKHAIDELDAYYTTALQECNLYAWWDIGNCGMGWTPGVVGYIKDIKLQLTRHDDKWHIMVTIATAKHEYQILADDLYLAKTSELELQADGQAYIGDLSPDNDIATDIMETFDMERWEGNFEMLTFCDVIASKATSYLEDKCLGNTCVLSPGEEGAVVESIDVTVESYECDNDILLSINGEEYDFYDLDISVN